MTPGVEQAHVASLLLEDPLFHVSGWVNLWKDDWLPVESSDRSAFKAISADPMCKGKQLGSILWAPFVPLSQDIADYQLIVSLACLVA